MPATRLETTMIVGSPWRNLLPASVFLALSVLIGTLVFQDMYEQALRGILEEENLRVARLSVALLEGAGDPSKTVKDIAGLADARVTIVELDGRVSADSLEDPESMENHADRPEILAALERGLGHSFRLSPTLRQEMLYTAVRMDGDDRKPRRFVRIARGLDRISELMVPTRRTIWLAAAVMTLVGILACYFFIEVRIAEEERYFLERHGEGGRRAGPDSGSG